LSAIFYWESPFRLYTISLHCIIMTFPNKTLPDKNADVIVVGGGPVGSYVAMQLAKRGIQTSVFEEHPQIGVPSHCAGHISIRSLKNIGFYPLPEGILENTFCAANFYSPRGTKFGLHLKCPVTVALNRERFDQYLAGQAEAAGARYYLNARVQSLLLSKGFAKGINIKYLDGNEVAIPSEIVIDAEGISSRLVRQTGLQTLKPNKLVYAVEAEVDYVSDVEQDAVEVYLGKAYAPGFYGWLIPRPDGSGKFGLATNIGDPRIYLKQLMTKHPVASKQLSKSKISKISYHSITLGGPIPKAYTNGFIAVGDCASQVKPTTGGGVIFGLTAAREAVEIVTQALNCGDVSSKILRAYQQRCNQLFDFDFRVMLRLRRFLDSLSDEKLDEVIRVCQKLGVDKALRDVDEIDFQGKMLLGAFRRPSVAAAFLYFGLLYLSTNP
jgi:digeranylgeranylglycerophospholipid reductase